MLYNTGVQMTNGFSVASGKPVDLKSVVDTIQDRNYFVTNDLSYDGMTVYVKSEQKSYQLIGNTWKEIGFGQTDFESHVIDSLISESSTKALSARQGKVLDNKITTHTSADIHITDAERTNWNTKASTALATSTTAGLMSAEDKKKLDELSIKVANLEKSCSEMLAKLKTAVFIG